MPSSVCSSAGGTGPSFTGTNGPVGLSDENIHVPRGTRSLSSTPSPIAAIGRTPFSSVMVANIQNFPP